MAVFTVPTPEATEWLVKGLRLLASNLEDGTSQHVHVEHFSTTTKENKTYTLIVEYRDIEIEGLVIRKEA